MFAFLTRLFRGALLDDLCRAHGLVARKPSNVELMNDWYEGRRGGTLFAFHELGPVLELTIGHVTAGARRDVLLVRRREGEQAPPELLLDRAERLEGTRLARAWRLRFPPVDASAREWMTAPLVDRGVREELEALSDGVTSVELHTRGVVLGLAKEGASTDSVDRDLDRGFRLLAAVEARYPELARAVLEGDLAAVRALLRGGAAPDQRGPAGTTALHHAARGGHAEIAGELLASGADPGAVASSGSTPLHLAASSSGGASIVRALLDRGAPVNARLERAGWTALHVAAAAGRAEVVQLLLERGADPGARDDEQQTPLERARRSGASDVVAILERASRR